MLLFTASPTTHNDMNIRVLKIVFDKNVDKIEYATFLPSGLAAVLGLVLPNPKLFVPRSECFMNVSENQIG